MKKALGWSLLLGLLVSLNPSLMAQTTVTTPETHIQRAQGRLHEVPGGFPEGGTGLVDPYIPPQTLITQRVIYGNAGNFQNGYSLYSPSGYVITQPTVIPYHRQRTYGPWSRQSYRVPGARVYETIENKGIVTETRTLP